MSRLPPVLIVLGLLPTLLGPLVGQEFDEDPSIWPDPVTIRGTIFAGGGGELKPAVFESFLERAGGPEARIVLMPTRSGPEVEARIRRLTAKWVELGLK